MRLVLLHIQFPRFINWKKCAKGPMIYFRGGGALALDDEACGPLLFQKGGIFPTTNKTLKVHSHHPIFQIKHSSGVHADRNIKGRRRLIYGNINSYTICMRLVLLHIQCPRFINWKKGVKGPMIYFGGGGGHWHWTMGHVAHYYFKRGAFSQQQIKHLRFIHIASYSILNIHQVFMLI